MQVADAILSNPADKTEVSLVYANVSEDDIILKDRIDAMEKKHPNFKVSHQHIGITVSSHGLLRMKNTPTIHCEEPGFGPWNRNRSGIRHTVSSNAGLPDPAALCL